MRGVTGLGLFSGVVATLCCVAPFVLVLFGVGGASLLLGLLEFKWFFLGVGGFVMAFGVAAAIWQSRRVCDPAQHRRNVWSFQRWVLGGSPRCTSPRISSSSR